MLHVSLPAFRVAGGMLLFLQALTLTFSSPGLSSINEVERRDAEKPGDIAVFPLAFPLIASPGALSAVVRLTGRAEGWSDDEPVCVRGFNRRVSGFLQRSLELHAQAGKGVSMELEGSLGKATLLIILRRMDRRFFNVRGIFLLCFQQLAELFLRLEVKLIAPSFGPSCGVPEFIGAQRDVRRKFRHYVP
jgi:hypothetical protein